MTVGELFMSASLIFISLPKHTYSGPPKSSELTVARAAFEVDLLITGEKVGWGGSVVGFTVVVNSHILFQHKCNTDGLFSGWVGP